MTCQELLKLAHTSKPHLTMEHVYLNQIMRDIAEVTSAAKWCAQRRIKGHVGDPLPCNMSVTALKRINADIVAFQYAIRRATETEEGEQP